MIPEDYDNINICDFVTSNPNGKKLKHFKMKNVSSVKRGELLGRGSHAQVYAGSYLGLEVAIKVYDNTQRASIAAFYGELNAYGNEEGSMSHPNIVQIIGAYQTDDQSFLVTERAHCNLLEWVRQNSNV